MPRIEAVYNRKILFRLKLPEYRTIAGLPWLRITLLISAILLSGSVTLLFLPAESRTDNRPVSSFTEEAETAVTENRILTEKILNLQTESGIHAGFYIQEDPCSLTECLLMNSADNLRRIELYQDRLRHIPHITPVKTGQAKIQVTSGFGMRRNPVNRASVEFHKGIDFRAAVRDAVRAAADGYVYTVNYSNRGYGNEIRIYHESGYATGYAHLHSIFVKKGDTVRAGQIIGLSGNTGYSTGPHLHYEVIGPEGYRNPADFLVF